MKEQLLIGYARSILENGAVLEKGQRVLIQADVMAYPFVRILTEEAYKMGAYEVDVEFSSSDVRRERIKKAPEEALSAIHEWKMQRRLYLAEHDCCSISLISEDPYAMDGLSEKRIMLANRASRILGNPFSQFTRTNRIKWTVAAVSNQRWASKIFPDIPAEEAEERLWEDILKASYADGRDPSKAWKEHIRDIKHRMGKLNGLGIHRLCFKNGIGTDFTAELCECGRFIGGTCTSTKNIDFSPNIPSEEVLTTPHRLKVNGTVHNSLPLVYAGSIIDDFEITFKDGKVIKFHAGQGEKLLENIIETDEGSCYLGECALVSAASPIKKAGHLFYNTLFDENAACHLALGNGYPDCVGGEDRSLEALKRAGFNTSSIHVDFMFGTDDLLCTGTDREGTEHVILENGQFVI